MSLEKAINIIAECFDKLAKKDEIKARNRPKPVFQSTHPKVTDNKDHYPLGDENQARNAWARANQYNGKAPSWWSGSVSELKNAVKRKVKSLYPNIKISNDKKAEDKITQLYKQAIEDYKNK